MKKLSLLGNEIEFSNSKVIPLALGATLSYFIIRFTQYAHDVTDKGFKSRFFKRAELHLEPYLLKREFNRPNSNLRHSYKSMSEIKFDSFVMFHEGMPPNTAAATFVGKKGGVVINENHLHVSNRELVAPFIKAGFYVAFRTRLGTDYVLPLIIAALALLTYLHSVRSAVVAWL